jgi:hypothetical protein
MALNILLNCSASKRILLIGPTSGAKPLQVKPKLVFMRPTAQLINITPKKTALRKELDLFRIAA